MIISNHFKYKTDLFNKCYHFEIWPFTVKDLFLDFAAYSKAFHGSLHLDPSYASMKYVLMGYAIDMTTTPPFDRIVPIALAETAEELNIFADVENLNPISCKINKPKLYNEF